LKLKQNQTRKKIELLATLQREEKESEKVITIEELSDGDSEEEFLRLLFIL
jgi:predicted RNA polymerase sigma factor